tara:strand:- start:43982 stop:44131 length:150 start_codon:yes stop_codon:yes gene_type:complete
MDIYHYYLYGPATNEQHEAFAWLFLAITLSLLFSLLITILITGRKGTDT